MADEPNDRQERPTGNANVHDPLPYIVKFRVFFLMMRHQSIMKCTPRRTP